MVPTLIPESFLRGIWKELALRSLLNLFLTGFWTYFHRKDLPRNRTSAAATTRSTFWYQALSWAFKDSHPDPTLFPTLWVVKNPLLGVWYLTPSLLLSEVLSWSLSVTSYLSTFIPRTFSWTFRDYFQDKPNGEFHIKDLVGIETVLLQHSDQLPKPFWVGFRYQSIWTQKL